MYLITFHHCSLAFVVSVPLQLHDNTEKKAAHVQTATGGDTIQGNTDTSQGSERQEWQKFLFFYWFIQPRRSRNPTHPSRHTHTHTEKKGYFVSWWDNSNLHQHESASVSLHLRGIKELACLHRDVSCSTWWRWMLLFFFSLSDNTSRALQAAEQRVHSSSMWDNRSLLHFSSRKKFPRSFFSPHFFYFGLDDEALMERSKVRERMMPTAPSEHFIMKRWTLFFVRH